MYLFDFPSKITKVKKEKKKKRIINHMAVMISVISKKKKL